jgi:hypothetical protein
VATKKLHKLKSLTVTKVALVGQGSNPEADMVFYKSDAPVARATFNEIMDAQIRRQILWKIYDATYTMQDAISSSIYGEGDVMSEIKQSAAQYNTFINNLLDELSSGKVEKSADVSLAQQVVARASAFLANLQKETTVPKIVKKALKDMTQEELDALFTSHEEIERQLAAAPPAPTPPPAPATGEPPAEILRELPEATQAYIRSLSASNVALQTSVTQTQEAVQRMADAADQRSYEDMARAEIPNLPGTIVEKGAQLRTLAKALTPEAFKAHLTILKAGDVAVQRSVLTEVGRLDVVPAGSAEDQLNTVARGYVAADTTGKTTLPQALTRAYNENPTLYKQMREARFTGPRHSSGA